MSGTAGYVRITILGFAISALWSALHTIILPVRLLDLVAESQKNTYLGIMTFIGLILALTVQPVAGALSDRTAPVRGRKPYLVAGIVMASCFLFGIGLFQTYALVFVSYALTQVASNVAQGPYQAFIPLMVPKTKWGRAAGIKSMLEALGGVALLYPIAILIDRYAAGWETGWLYLSLALLAVLLVMALLITMLFVKEPRVSGESPITTAVARLSLSAIARSNPRFLRFLISRLLFFLTFTTIQSFALYFLRDVAGVESPAKATAGFLIVAAAGMLVSAYPAGHLSDRLGRRKLGLISGVTGAIAVLLLLFFPQIYPVIMAASGLIGIAFGIFLSTSWALATDLAVKGKEARYLSLASAATAGGSAMARLIGPLIDAFNGMKANSGYTVMLIICLVAISAGTALLIDRK